MSNGDATPTPRHRYQTGPVPRCGTAPTVTRPAHHTSTPTHPHKPGLSTPVTELFQRSVRGLLRVCVGVVYGPGVSSPAGHPRSVLPGHRGSESMRSDVCPGQRAAIEPAWPRPWSDRGRVDLDPGRAEYITGGIERASSDEHVVLGMPNSAPLPLCASASGPACLLSRPPLPAQHPCDGSH